LKNNETYRKSCVEGAKKLLFDSLQISQNDKVLILASESMMEFAKYIFKAAVDFNRKDLFYIIIPENFRPIVKVLDLLSDIAKESNGIIHVIDRKAEEDYTFIRPFRALCENNKCKYLYLYDAKLNYLENGGINADYKIVDKKCKEVARLLKESSEVSVSSKLGTSLSFKLYDKVFPRSPIFDEGQYSNQAPEGETMTVPLEESFEGRLVVDGPVTGIGKAKELIVWEFKNGKVSKVNGNRDDLDRLFKFLKSSDPTIKSLEGISIAEFALGTNDWAKVDDNISNCEKVSGTVHFGMGHRVGNVGKERGEKYHFDSMLINDVSVKIKNNKSDVIDLISSGKLLVNS